MQSTGIKQHLEQMADLLCQEEEEKDPRDPGAMVSVGTLRIVGVCLKTSPHSRVLAWSSSYDTRSWTPSTLQAALM